MAEDSPGSSGKRQTSGRRISRITRCNCWEARQSDLLIGPAAGQVRGPSLGAESAWAKDTKKVRPALATTLTTLDTGPGSMLEPEVQEG